MRKKKIQERLPEIVFSSANTFTTKQIGKLVKERLLRKLIPRVYTSNNLEEDKVIIQKNLWMLIANLLPESMLSHRSAIEFKLTDAENIYLTGQNKKVYNWQGIKIRMTIGPQNLANREFPITLSCPSSVTHSQTDNRQLTTSPTPSHTSPSPQ